MDIDPTLFWNFSLTIFVMIGGWFVRSVIADLRRIENMIHACERDLRDRFVPREYHHEVIQRLETQHEHAIARVEDKIDKLTDAIENARMNPICGWTPGQNGPCGNKE